MWSTNSPWALPVHLGGGVGRASAGQNARTRSVAVPAAVEGYLSVMVKLLLLSAGLDVAATTAPPESTML
jgi:hypothetical protein